MSVWDQLAEARIREWLQRPAAEREAATVPLEPGLPLELQLAREIAQLDRMAADADDPDDPDDAAALRGRASALMLQLMVLLEGQGRPLAAQHFAEQRQALRDSLPRAAKRSP